MLEVSRSFMASELFLRDHLRVQWEHIFSLLRQFSSIFYIVIFLFACFRAMSFLMIIGWLLVILRQEQPWQYPALLCAHTLQYKSIQRQCTCLVWLLNVVQLINPQISKSLKLEISFKLASRQHHVNLTLANPLLTPSI